MVMLTYYPVWPEPEGDASPAAPGVERGPYDVAWGFTLADVDGCARIAVSIDRWSRWADVEERHNTAWCAIVEHLLTATEQPTQHDLVSAGQRASGRLLRAAMTSTGKPESPTAAGRDYMPAFARYWSNPVSPWEDAVIDRITLHQVWTELPDWAQWALMVLATHGRFDTAAQAAGCTVAELVADVREARALVLEAWHDGETPSEVWVDDTIHTSTTGPGKPAMQIVRDRKNARLPPERRTNQWARGPRTNGATARAQVSAVLGDGRSRSVAEIAATLGWTANRVNGHLTRMGARGEVARLPAADASSARSVWRLVGDDKNTADAA